MGRIDRRTFIGLMASEAMLLVFPENCFGQNNKKVLVIRKTSKYDKVIDKNMFDRLYVHDLKSGEFKFIELPHHFSHSILKDPFKDNCVVVIEQEGDRLSWVDIGSQKVIKTIKCPNGKKFYGHGIFIKSSRDMLVTGKNKSGEGLLLKYSYPEFKLKGIFKSFGYNPHDMILTKDGRVVVTNKGKVNPKTAINEFASVTVVDYKSNRLERKIEFSIPNIRTAHIEFLEGSTVAVGASQYKLKKGKKYRRDDGFVQEPAPLIFVDIKNGSIKESAPERVSEKLLYNLSLEASSGTTLAVTSAGSNLVSFWDKKSLSLLGEVELPSGDNPFGVSYVNEGHYIVSGSSGDGYVVKKTIAKGYSIKKIKLTNDYGAAGSHIEML